MSPMESIRPGDPPAVSVCVIAYNQQRFIGECLESIFSQETNFKFEVIVGDDGSEDGTREIIGEFAARYPDIMRVVFLEKNQFKGCENYRRTHAVARGVFVAHLDGDDVMCPGKLQRQYDFLTAHPECALVGHQVFVVDEASRIVGLSPVGTHPIVSDIHYLLQHQCFFTHSSKMYRKSARQNELRVLDPLFVDFALHVEHASCGNIGYMNEPLGRYRQAANSHSRVTGAPYWNLIELTLKGYARAEELGIDARAVKRESSRYVFKAAFYCLGRGDAEGFGYCLELAVRIGVSELSALSRFALWTHRAWPIGTMALAKAAISFRNFLLGTQGAIDKRSEKPPGCGRPQ